MPIGMLQAAACGIPVFMKEILTKMNAYLLILYRKTVKIIYILFKLCLDGSYWRT